MKGKMRSTKLPEDAAGWEHLVGALVKSELKLGGVNYIDLQAELKKLNVDQSTSNISANPNPGRFSAVFLLQAMVAIGVHKIELPDAQNR